MDAETDIDALIAAFYAAFDNRGARPPAGQALRAMFAPGATVTRVSAEGVQTWDVEGFVAPREAMLSAGGGLCDFHEWEVEATTAVAANIASRASRYEKAGVLEGAPYGGGGRKFIQLCRVAGRWAIVSVLWEDDD